MESIYEDEYLDDLYENDQIDAREQAFMIGYEGAA
jgi:hypothetical protein